jgi:hypothetical protein
MNIRVNAGGSLRDAINQAAPGDVIQLEAGATFQVGQIDVPVKSDGLPITITSTAELPNRRLTAADAGILPTIAAGIGVSPLQFLAGVRGWTLDGLRFLPNTQGQNTVLMVEGADGITFDRLLFEGDPTWGQRRFILGNGTNISLTRSHIVGCFDYNNGDSQTFCAYNGAGPYIIANNTLEAASENIMFGGADSAKPENIPSHIRVEGNYCYKRLSWKGTARGVKNLFELKQAKGAIVRNNVFESNWTDAQSGFAILFTVRNDDGNAPWTVVEDVLFEHNIIKGTENGLNVLGCDSYHSSGRTQRIVVRNNQWQTEWKFFQAGGEVNELTITDNQVVNGGYFGVLYHGAIWPTAENLNGPRPTRYAVSNLTIERNTGYVHDGGAVLGEETGWAPAGLSTPTAQHPNGHAPGAVYVGNVFTEPVSGPVEPPVEPPPPPPPPPPTDPCVVDPLTVSVSQWPASNSGSRRLQFSTNKKWSSATVTWPGTLTVTDTRGCTKTITKK